MYLEPRFDPLDFPRAAHLALQIGALLVGQAPRMDLEPAVDLALVNVGHDLTALVEQRHHCFVRDGIAHRIGGLHEVAELGEGALFLLGDGRAGEGYEARVREHLLHAVVHGLSSGFSRSPC